LKKRFDDELICFLIKLSWWDLQLEVIKKIAKDLSSPPTTHMLVELIEKYRLPDSVSPEESQ
jgi:hypothetical protein